MAPPLRNAEARPLAGPGTQEGIPTTTPILTAVTDPDWEEPAYVLRVQINDLGGTRVYIYRSLISAERAVARATKRGRESWVTLCTLIPVGVA